MPTHRQRLAKGQAERPQAHLAEQFGCAVSLFAGGVTLAVDDQFSLSVEWFVNGGRKPGANGAAAETVHPRQEHAPVGQHGRTGRLVGNSQVFGVTPGMPMIGTDTAVDVEIPAGGGVVNPGKGSDFAIGRHAAAQIQ